MLSNHLILCCPLLLLPTIFPSIRVFSNNSALHIRWPKYWSISFSISSSNEYSGFTSFRIDWLDLLAIQGTLKTLQHWFKSISSLVLSLLYGPDGPYMTHPYMTTGKTIALTIQIFVSKVLSLLFNTLSRFVIAFLPRNNHFFFFVFQSCSHYLQLFLEPKKIKPVTVSIFSPSICHEVMRLDAMILVFWMLNVFLIN